jgi:adenosylcobinamide-GDP ribazoletransferase
VREVLRRIKALLAFLTIIPVGMGPDCLKEAAGQMHLFPLVGAFVGSLAGLFAWFALNALPGPVAGMLTLGFLLALTGLHHTDGLLDFGDGLAFRGSPQEKIGVMRDQRTGAGGLALGLVSLSTTALCIASLSTSVVVQSLVASEASAKLAMVMTAWAGRSASEGMGSQFVEAMHSSHRRLRLMVAMAISLGMAVPLLWITGLVAILMGMAVALIITDISDRNFKGVTGDVMGATNELARMASLIAILVILRWA